MSNSVEWHEARRIAYSAALANGAIPIAIEDALSRRLSADVIASVELPPAPVAMMDGFAVSGPGPWQLSGTSRPGTLPLPISPGQALAVSTGTHLSTDAEFVIPDEDAQVTGMYVRTEREFARGKHIRPQGDEVQPGDVLAAAGTLVTPPLVGLLASAGIDTIAVTHQPIVEVITTGDEVRSEGTPQPGLVRDSLSMQIPAWVEHAGGQVLSACHLRDDLDELVSAIRSSIARVIVTTGGTANGQSDFVRKAVATLGGEILVGGIAARPGRPSLLAQLPGQRFLLGLPGNPLAASCGFITLGIPLLSALTNAPLPELRPATLADALPADGVRLVPVQVRGVSARYVGHDSTAMMRGLSVANALAIVPPSNERGDRSIQLADLPWRTN